MRGCASFIAGLLLVAACTDSTQPSDKPSTAVRLAAVSKTSQLVVANGLVPDLPTVTAYDTNGAPVAGAVVTFAIESEGGSIEHSVDTTNSSGVAKLPLWRVGTKTSVRNIVSARLPQGDTVVFAVTVIPGPPASVQKRFGDNLLVEAHKKFSVFQLAQVLDVYDNPVPGYPVQFVVSKGDGVADDDLTTNGEGFVSQSGWIAGEQGEQVLRMSVGGLSASFSAIAVNTIPPCAEPLVLDSIAGVDSELGQCMRDGRFNATFYIRNPSASARLFEVFANTFDSYVELRDVDSKLIAWNDNGKLSDSQLRATLPPGIYQVLVFQNGTGDTGGEFYLRVQNAQATSGGCEGLFVTRGVTVNGVPTPFACTEDEKPVYENRFRMHLYAGETIGVNLKKTAADFGLNDYQVVITTVDGELLAAGTPSAATVDAVYEADREIDVLIDVSAVGPNFPYSISFR